MSSELVLTPAEARTLPATKLEAQSSKVFYFWRTPSLFFSSFFC
jgi:hypothetical protein